MRTARLFAIFLTLVLVSSASAQDVEAVNRELNRIDARVTTLTRQAVAGAPLRGPTYVEGRLTDGELFFRLQDYLRASIIFTDIVEHHATHRAYPDALFLLGESLYRAGDLLGARTQFRRLLARASEASFRPYVQRALGRLIKIAIETKDFEGVEGYFEQLSRIPPGEIEAATAYYRAKYLYGQAVPSDFDWSETFKGESPILPPASVDRQRLEQARASFESVPRGTPFFLRSRYFAGAIYTILGQFDDAIAAFRSVTESRSRRGRQVIDLANLALGRLFYQRGDLQGALLAYQSVPRTSAHFDAALYEVAWVHLALSDAVRAERALEVLLVAAPESPLVPEARVLRGNLLVREGRLGEARRAFREVRAAFEPVREELAGWIASISDPLQYFRERIAERSDAFDPAEFLPPRAAAWAASEGLMGRGLRVLSDLSQSRRLVRETEGLVRKLKAALSAGGRANIFPGLRAQKQDAIALSNRLAGVRRALIRIEEERSSGGRPDLARVRRERRSIEALVGGMPVREEDFVVRDDRALGRFKALERQLQALGIEVLGLEARRVAAARFLADTPQGRDTEEVRRIQTELEAQREVIEEYRERLGRLSEAIEVGRVQVGVGDKRYADDAELRRRYDALVAEERRLMEASGIRPSPEIDRLFGRVATLEARLERHEAAIDRAADDRTADMRQVVEEEERNLEDYKARLGALTDDGEEVLAALAYSNLKQIHRRFRNLVMRADAGIVDVAWARREEHKTRLDMLIRERARDLQALDDEFRDVMDEGASVRGVSP